MFLRKTLPVALVTALIAPTSWVLAAPPSHASSDLPKCAPVETRTDTRVVLRFAAGPACTFQVPTTVRAFDYLVVAGGGGGGWDGGSGGGGGGVVSHAADNAGDGTVTVQVGHGGNAGNLLGGILFDPQPGSNSALTLPLGQVVTAFGGGAGANGPFSKAGGVGGAASVGTLKGGTGGRGAGNVRSGGLTGGNGPIVTFAGSQLQVSGGGGGGTYPFGGNSTVFYGGAGGAGGGGRGAVASGLAIISPAESGKAPGAGGGGGGANGTNAALRVGGGNGAAGQVAIAYAAAPEAPTGLTASLSSGNAYIAWTPSESVGFGVITAQHIFMSADGVTWSEYPVMSVSEDVRDAVITLPKEPGRKYFFRVAAFNSGEVYSAFSNVASMRVPGPSSQPTAVTAQMRDGKLVVGWALPEDDGGMAVTGFRVYYRTLGSSGQWSSVDAPVGTAAEVPVASASYEVYVVAVNELGDGTASDVVVAEFMAPSPTPNPTPTDSFTPAPTESESPTPAPVPTDTGSPSPSATETATPTETGTPAPTESITPTPTPTPTETVTPSPAETGTPEPTPTASGSPTPTPTETVTPTPTPTPTETPDPTPLPALELATPVSNETGFTVSIVNAGVFPDGTEFTAALVASNGQVQVNGAVVTVTGLAAGESATVLVSADKAGYVKSSRSVTGSALQPEPTPTPTSTETASPVPAPTESAVPSPSETTVPAPTPTATPPAPSPVTPAPIPAPADPGSGAGGTPTPEPTPTTPVGPAPPLDPGGQLLPGDYSITVDGTAVVFGRYTAGGNGFTQENVGGLSLSVASLTRKGEPRTAGAGGRLTLVRGGSLVVSLAGAAAPDDSTIGFTLKESRRLVVQSRESATRTTVFTVPVDNSLGADVAQVQALNREGKLVSFSFGVQVVDEAPLPEKPLDVRVVKVTAKGTALVTWLPPVNADEAQVAGYLVRVRVVGTSRGSSAVFVGTRAVIQGLVPGKRCKFRVSALGQEGKGSGATSVAVRIPG